MPPPESPSPPTVPASMPTAGTRARRVATPASAAAWLDPRDDVATALRELPAGTRVTVATGGHARDIVVRETIALGHKFALHGIAAGRRVRKYGECIGRLTSDVAAGAWVHVHNLATTATRDDADGEAWRMQAAPEGGARVLSGTACDEGVSPVYDAGTDHLYWLDARAPVLHALDLARGVARSIALPQAASVALLLDDGTLALGTAAGFLRCDPRTGTCAVVRGGAAPASGMRWTAAACDAHGRLWVTAANLARADVAGSLASLSASPASRIAPVAGTPTGLAATRDGRSLVVVDAARACVERYGIDAGTGDVATAHRLADAGALPGDLWGAALDVDDGVWCALRDAGCVLRVANDGSVTRVVRVPAAQPTGCAFAGPGLRELVVTTARGHGGDAAGHVLALGVGVAGIAPHRLAHGRFDAMGTA